MNVITPSLPEMFGRLLRAEGQGRSAKTVEVFGWMILAESVGIVFVPQLAVALLHLPEMVVQAENYFRLVGLLVGGLGMLYVAAGRLNAQGFVFASLLDRPLVPPAMLILWLCGILPWQLALAFAVQDFASFLWTLSAWRAEHRMTLSAG
ncbi:MAG: hypothetical protein K2Y35_14070 [Burkholderiales bacterium]|nr:hypothetical protein [Burkholderiales bacterium]